MSDKYILKNGTPVLCEDLLTWGRWLESANDERIIGRTEIGDVKVSTVFLGLDHSFGGGIPVLFETMIFGGPHDGEQWRYSTRHEAVLWHTHAVEVAKEAK